MQSTNKAVNCLDSSDKQTDSTYTLRPLKLDPLNIVTMLTHGTATLARIWGFSSIVPLKAPTTQPVHPLRLEHGQRELTFFGLGLFCALGQRGFVLLYFGGSLVRVRLVCVRGRRGLVLYFGCSFFRVLGRRGLVLLYFGSSLFRVLGFGGLSHGGGSAVEGG
jgi:hypothetical protein